MGKKIQISEKELVGLIKKNLNESNYMYANIERAEILQDVMDRILEYGEDYLSALNDLNGSFEIKKYKRVSPGEFDLPKGVKVKSTYRPQR